MKSAYFYSIIIKEKDSEAVQPITLFKNIIENIIQPNNNQNDPREYYTVDITQPEDTKKTIVDIFDNNDTHFFARLSKQKPSNSVVGRNYNTLKTEPVMGNFPDNVKGIESYCFVYINYQTLIAEIVTSQYSPDQAAVGNLIKMNSNYYLEFYAIPNRTGIDCIFQHRKPVISSFTVDIPTPTPALLEEFGFTDEDITELFENNIRAKITLAPAHGTTLASNEDVPKVVDKIKQSAAVTGAILKARSASVKSKEYNLYNETFKYDITIETSHVENGHSISYSEVELINIAKNKLIENYNSNYDIIVPLANRG